MRKNTDAGARGEAACSSVKALAMGGERRGDTCLMEGLANWTTRMSLTLQRRIALARDKRRAMKSRVSREIQARFCESLGVKSLGATRQSGGIILRAGLFLYFMVSPWMNLTRTSSGAHGRIAALAGKSRQGDG